MCGRYARRADKQRIAEAFDTGEAEDFAFQLAPSYNVAPQSMQPVVRLGGGTKRRELVLMRWGLVPFWARDTKIGFSTINARAETVTTSATFREAMKSRRCLVPADAFYEWQKIDTKTKWPYAIAMKDGSLFAFAGLWEKWKDPNDTRSLETFSIITTDPNELMKPENGLALHDRMPVIVPANDYERWLAPADPSQLPVDLLRPYPAEDMKAWRVDARVGNVRNDEPALIEPFQPQNDRPSLGN